jgi:hypothetical protein
MAKLPRDPLACQRADLLFAAFILNKTMIFQDPFSRILLAPYTAIGMPGWAASNRQ